MDEKREFPTTVRGLNAVSRALRGDPKFAVWLKPAITYPANDADGCNFIDLSGYVVNKIQIINRDATNFCTVQIYTGTAYPDSKAHLVIGTVWSNGLIFEYKAGGVAGNSYQVELLNPGAANQTLSVVETSATRLTINLATDAGSAITSTPATIKAACDALNAGAGLTYANVYAEGAAVVAAAVLTSLAGGAVAGATARKNIIDRPIGTMACPKRIAKEETLEIATLGNVLGVSAKFDTAAGLLQIYGLG